MTKYIVKDKVFSAPHYWHYWRDRHDRHDCHVMKVTKCRKDAYEFTADELKNSAIRSRILLDKKRYVLIPVKES